MDASAQQAGLWTVTDPAPPPGGPAALQGVGATFLEMTPGFPGMEAGQRSRPRRSHRAAAKHPLPLHRPCFPVLTGV